MDRLRRQRLFPLPNPKGHQSFSGGGSHASHVRQLAWFRILSGYYALHGWFHRLLLTLYGRWKKRVRFDEYQRLQHRELDEAECCGGERKHRFIRIHSPGSRSPRSNDYDGEWQEGKNRLGRQRLHVQRESHLCGWLL